MVFNIDPGDPRQSRCALTSFQALVHYLQCLLWLTPKRPSLASGITPKRFSVNWSFENIVLMVTLRTEMPEFFYTDII